MSVLVDLVVPATDFVFERAFVAHPGLRVQFDQVVPLGGDAPVAAWMTRRPDRRTESRPDRQTDARTDRLGDALAADPAVTAVERLDRTDDAWLFGVELSPDAVDLLDILGDTGAVCLSCAGRDAVWQLTLRYRSRQRLADCYHRCVAADLDLTVRSVHPLAASPEERTPAALTAVQLETLETALEAGYFAVPRETTLQELAAELGVSDTAASQRLRRGIEALLTQSLPAAPPASH
jgi:hypothetical protein